MTTFNGKIQMRFGSAAQWTASNLTLLAGEPAFETDTGKIKIGNGLLDWISLPYAVDHLHNNAGQVKANYNTLTSTNFVEGVLKEYEVGSGDPSVVTAPTTTWPFGQAVYDPDFFIAGIAGTADDRLRENDHPGQSHNWRFLGTYANKASVQDGNITVRLYNPDSGFSVSDAFALPAGVTSGTWSGEVQTISDPASLAVGRGYRLQAGASFTDADLIITIDSITRFSLATELD